MRWFGCDQEGEALSWGASFGLLIGIFMGDLSWGLVLGALIGLLVQQMRSTRGDGAPDSSRD